MNVFLTNVWLTLTAVGLIFAGCAVQQQKPPMTPLEIQSIQTREFESPKKIVFASVVSVFQDLGYTIKNADLNTGFINAESAAQNSTATIGEGIFVEILGEVILGDVAGSNQSTQNTEQTAATAFIEEIGNRARVRLNFVTTRQSSSAQGQNTRRDTPILDVRIYTNAFERIENAIFIRSGN